jgi:hypothetical protein
MSDGHLCPSIRITTLTHPKSFPTPYGRTFIVERIAIFDLKNLIHAASLQLVAYITTFPCQSFYPEA